MTWEDIRRHYAELFAQAKKRHGETQETIAARGKLSGQGKISEMLSNHNIGPRVETFVKAVEGLGLRPSEFFAQIERLQNLALKGAAEPKHDSPILSTGGDHVAAVPAEDADDLRELETVLGRLIGRRARRVAQARGQASGARSSSSRDRRRSRKNR